MGCRRRVPTGHRFFSKSLTAGVIGAAALLCMPCAAWAQSAGSPPATIRLADLQDQFQAVADRVAPSVVAVSASVSAADSDDAVRSDSLNGEKLEGLLNRATRTVGSGFVIDPNGYIITNEHVVGESQQLWVTTDDGKVYPAIVVGSDPRADLAVLKIPASNLPVVSYAPSNSVRRGQWTIALGNPYGLADHGEMAMCVGVVSATDRSLPKLSSRENRLYANLIQTTAEINPGNSGGPLFDLEGRVIGINSAVVLPQKQTNGIGFAMPVNESLLARIEHLKQGREITYGYLGVMVSTPTTRQRQDAGVASNIGAAIDSIETQSPADGADLRIGDVVTSLGGHIVRDSDHFVELVGSLPVDQPMQLELHRGGATVSLEMTTRRRALPSVAVTRQNTRYRWRGLLLGPIPANWGRGKEQPKGVMILGVEANSAAAREGLQAGAVITAIGGKTIADLIELQTLVNDLPIEQCRIEIAPGFETVASGN
jgi:serine protease Do